MRSWLNRLNFPKPLSPYQSSPSLFLFLSSLFSSPGFPSISILLYFIESLLSKAGHSRRCRLPTEQDFLTGFFCVFVHRAPQKHSRLPVKLLAQSILVVFIVIHPRGCILLIEWFSTVYPEWDVVVKKTSASLKAVWKVEKQKQERRKNDFPQSESKWPWVRTVKVCTLLLAFVVFSIDMTDGKTSLEYMFSVSLSPRTYYLTWFERIVAMV